MQYNIPKKLKILQVHNHYQERTGGEFITAEMDKLLLESHGHKVIRYIRNNDEINNYGILKKIFLFVNTIWSVESYKEISKILDKERPDILHMHNFFPLISPSVLYAAGKRKIPVVWTLNNYRLICAEGQFLRDKHVCEICLTKSRWNSVKYKCYRNSRLASFVTVFMNKLHALLGTWKNKVDLFIPLTEFGKNIFIKGGIDKRKIAIKPNIIFPELDKRDESIIEDYALFLGQFSQKKGVEMLVSVWKDINYKLIMAGSGVFLERLKVQAKKENSNIEFLGAIPHSKAIELLKKANFLLLPSLHNEGFPLVLSEALALGVPIITSNTGPLPELVEHLKNGLLIRPGDEIDLKEKIQFAFDNKKLILEMGKNSRKLYERKYNIHQNYDILMNIYYSVLSQNKSIIR